MLVKRFPNGMAWPHCTKTHKLVWVLGNGPLPDKVPGGEALGDSSLTQPIFGLYQTLEISVCFMHCNKSYSLFTLGKTHILHPHMDRQDFCQHWNFSTLCSFIWFVLSLTLFVKDKDQSNSGLLHALILV